MSSRFRLILQAHRPENSSGRMDKYLPEIAADIRRRVVRAMNAFEYETLVLDDAGIDDLSALLVESNHDESLLQNDTKRPWSVKQRILSRHGHLSNQAAADLVASAASPSLRHIALAHLSADCNTPELARTAVREKLESTGIPLPEIHCPGTPESPLPLVFEI